MFQCHVMTGSEHVLQIRYVDRYHAHEQKESKKCQPSRDGLRAGHCCTLSMYVTRMEDGR